MDGRSDLGTSGTWGESIYNKVNDLLGSDTSSEDLWGPNEMEDDMDLSKFCETVSETVARAEESSVPDTPPDEDDVSQAKEALTELLRVVGLTYSGTVTTTCTPGPRGSTICTMTCQLSRGRCITTKLAKFSRAEAILAATEDVTCQVKEHYFPAQAEPKASLVEFTATLAEFCRETKRPAPVGENMLEAGLYRGKVRVGDRVAESGGLHGFIIEAEGAAAKAWLDLFGGDWRLEMRSPAMADAESKTKDDAKAEVKPQMADLAVVKHDRAAAPRPKLSSRPPLPTQFSLDFFALRSLHQFKAITVNPERIDAFAASIYQQQLQLCVNNLPITEAEYVRMCKTLLLKRVQDVHEKCYNVRAQNFVRLYRNVMLPKPLYDLFSAMGKGFDTSTGWHYYMSPVAMPNATPPNWWTVDNAILTNYIQMTCRMAHLYTHVEFPSSNDVDGRAIHATRITANAAGTMSDVLSATSTPTPADGLLRMMCPDALFAGDVPAVADCGYRLCDRQWTVSVVQSYIGSAVVYSNS